MQLEDLEESLSSSSNIYESLIEELESTLQDLNNDEVTAHEQLEKLIEDLKELNSEFVLIKEHFEQFEAIMENHDPNWRENESLVEWYEQIDHQLSQGIEANTTIISEWQQVIDDLEEQNNDQTDLLEKLLNSLQENQNELLVQYLLIFAPLRS